MLYRQLRPWQCPLRITTPAARRPQFPYSNPRYYAQSSPESTSVNTTTACAVLFRHSNSATTEKLLENIAPINVTKHHSATKEYGAVLLFTPCFAQRLAYDSTFLPAVVNRLCDELISDVESGCTLQTTIAVVDRIPRPSHLEVAFHRTFHPPVGDNGWEGMAYSFAPSSALKLNNSSIESSGQDSHLKSITFNLISMATHKRPFRRTRVEIPLANTVFQAGRDNIFTSIDWKRPPGTDSLQIKQMDSLGHTEVVWPQSHMSYHYNALSAPLIPLTKPRKIEAAMGNVVRRISALEQAEPAVPASQELERAVDDYFVARELPPSTVAVWALIQSFLPTQEENQRVLTPTPELWSTNPPKYERHFMKRIVEGGRLHRVLSGGGGWGNKAGLISLDPVSRFGRPGEIVNEDEVTDHPEAGAFPVEMLGNAAKVGDYIQFFIARTDCEDSSLDAEHIEEHDSSTMDFGTIPSTIDAMPDLEPLNAESIDGEKAVEVFPNHFGALSEKGFSIEISHSEQNDSNSVGLSKVDVPYSRLSCRVPHDDQSRSDLRSDRTDGKHKDGQGSSIRYHLALDSERLNKSRPLDAITSEQAHSIAQEIEAVAARAQALATQYADWLQLGGTDPAEKDRYLRLVEETKSELRKSLRLTQDGLAIEAAVQKGSTVDVKEGVEDASQEESSVRRPTEWGKATITRGGQYRGTGDGVRWKSLVVSDDPVTLDSHMNSKKSGGSTWSIRYSGPRSSVADSISRRQYSTARSVASAVSSRGNPILLGKMSGIGRAFVGNELGPFKAWSAGSGNATELGEKGGGTDRPSAGVLIRINGRSTRTIRSRQEGSGEVPEERTLIARPLKKPKKLHVLRRLSFGEERNKQVSRKPEANTSYRSLELQPFSKSTRVTGAGIHFNRNRKIFHYERPPVVLTRFSGDVTKPSQPMPEGLNKPEVAPMAFLDDLANPSWTIPESSDNSSPVPTTFVDDLMNPAWAVPEVSDKLCPVNTTLLDDSKRSSWAVPDNSNKPSPMSQVADEAQVKKEVELQDREKQEARIRQRIAKRLANLRQIPTIRRSYQESRTVRPVLAPPPESRKHGELTISFTMTHEAINKEREGKELRLSERLNASDEKGLISKVVIGSVVDNTGATTRLPERRRRASMAPKLRRPKYSKRPTVITGLLKREKRASVMPQLRIRKSNQNPSMIKGLSEQGSVASGTTTFSIRKESGVQRRRKMRERVPVVDGLDVLHDQLSLRKHVVASPPIVVRLRTPPVRVRPMYDRPLIKKHTVAARLSIKKERGSSRSTAARRIPIRRNRGFENCLRPRTRQRSMEYLARKSIRLRRPSRGLITKIPSVKVIRAYSDYNEPHHLVRTHSNNPRKLEHLSDDEITQQSIKFPTKTATHARLVVRRNIRPIPMGVKIKLYTDHKFQHLVRTQAGHPMNHLLRRVRASTPENGELTSPNGTITKPVSITKFESTWWEDPVQYAWDLMERKRMRDERRRLEAEGRVHVEVEARSLDEGRGMVDGMEEGMDDFEDEEDEAPEAFDYRGGFGGKASPPSDAEAAPVLKDALSDLKMPFPSTSQPKAKGRKGRMSALAPIGRSPSRLPPGSIVNSEPLVKDALSDLEMQYPPTPGTKTKGRNARLAGLAPVQRSPPSPPPLPIDATGHMPEVGISSNAFKINDGVVRVTRVAEESNAGPSSSSEDGVSDALEAEEDKYKASRHVLAAGGRKKRGRQRDAEGKVLPGRRGLDSSALKLVEEVRALLRGF
ncbi:hypothetical protein EJ08DRAFT_650624 [Tothia fuscella]|uniref:Uncharacterized protein n=1 Tax=Tothia fuscella TaxID=1048955 RepID=A0A9P4NNN7_9PEZI|nr:hypothetical protein EJ08DRAFT_650624 [Tothia fuscella]